ncbi:hypothetical protein B4123_2797 [Bacillus paralicheniformis]|nr:hypothetical protein B4123_2765 [Bacillus paralicheniformis]OLG10808.1 hypothetical protein B4123_2797 [Bacillus paralicheniformis]
MKYCEYKTVAITHIAAVIPASSLAVITMMNESDNRNMQQLNRDIAKPLINSCFLSGERTSDRMPNGNRSNIWVTP